MLAVKPGLGVLFRLQRDPAHNANSFQHQRQERPVKMKMREILQATEPLLSNSSVNIERRQCSRVLLGCPVMLTSTQGIMMGQIIDISLGGAFVCCKKPLNVKESLELQFRLSPDSANLTVKGVVVRSKVHCLDSDIKCHGMGVRFNDLSPESSLAIKGVVEKGVEV